jgi:hypothetical protein
MSMSLDVIGFVPPDEKWLVMKQVYDACKKAGIDRPKEVDAFFNDEAPDDNGVKIELPVTEWHEDMCEGYELDISAIPKHVTKIRFYASY